MKNARSIIQSKRTIKVAFFKQEQRVGSSKEKSLKGDCRLFSRLLISCQTRQCDLQKFFRHENQSSPASLGDGGKLHTCQKSQLTEILHVQVDIPERAPEGEVIIVDGSAMVNTTPPRTSKTFEDYAREDILPKIKLIWHNIQKSWCSLWCLHDV